MSTPNQSYRILVLVDDSKASVTALRNAVNLSDTLGGTVSAFHVIPARELAEQENQLATLRFIQRKYRKVSSKIKDMVASVAEKEHTRIPIKIHYGNIKNQIASYVADTNPDILVVGNKKNKKIGFLGDGITQFVIDTCKCNILVSTASHQFHSYTDVSLGIYGDSLEQEGFEVIHHIHEKSDKPARFFSIGNTKDSKSTSTQDKVSYVFTEGANALEGLSNYVKRSNTQLFCISAKESPVKQIVKQLDIPVFILNG